MRRLRRAGASVNAAAVRMLLVLPRLALAAMLLVAGMLKLQAPATFATEIANYQLFPALAPFVAVTLPVVEVLLGAGLLVFQTQWRRAALVATLFLLVTFLVAVGSAYFRGIDIACGCFGGGGDAITVMTVLRNIGLVALGVASLVVDLRWGTGIRREQER